MSGCAARLAARQVSALQASPTQRAMESAAILGDRLGLDVEPVSAMDEIDIGEWTGRAFADLRSEPRWQAWNSRRGSTRPPGGEGMAELQRRVLAHLEGLRSRWQDGCIVIVSHAEPIRAALLHYLGRPLDDFLSVEVGTASVSVLRLDDDVPRVVAINQGAQP
jgi:probable phosphoglycerate mutase